MEQRKLIQHGASSLTAALPLKWLKQRGLKKGDTIYIDIEGSKLIVSTKESLKMGRISVDVSKLDRTSTLLYIQSLYRFGYDEIEVNFKKPTTTHFRLNKQVTYSSVIHYIVGRCVGVEVIEETNKKIIIKHIIKEQKEDFKLILRRIFLLLNETAEIIMDAAKENNREVLKTMENRHDNITKFVNYCLRMLNKYGHPDVKQTCFYYHIIASLDKIVDVIKYAVRTILDYNKKLTKEAIKIWEQANKSIRTYYEFFYNFDLEKVEELDKNRNYVKDLLKKNINKIPRIEIMILTDIREILELILDLTDFRMGLEY